MILPKLEIRAWDAHVKVKGLGPWLIIPELEVDHAKVDKGWDNRGT